MSRGKRRSPARRANPRRSATTADIGCRASLPRGSPRVPNGNIEMGSAAWLSMCGSSASASSQPTELPHPPDSTLLTVPRKERNDVGGQVWDLATSSGSTGGRRGPLEFRDGCLCRPRITETQAREFADLTPNELELSICILVATHAAREHPARAVDRGSQRSRPSPE